MADTQKEGKSVLVIAAFGSWIEGERRTGKIHTHLQPMAEAADHVTYLTIGPTRPDTNGITYRRVSPSRWNVVEFLRLFVAALYLARSGRYDLIASFSLVPYGLFALAAKAVSGSPAHLGIIGMDLDVHAEAAYAPLVWWAFRQFDVITVAGTEYRERLLSRGISEGRVHTILHPVDGSFANASRVSDPSYDLLWVGRMSREKHPVRFVEIVATLHDRGQEVAAAMVGDGPCFERVSEAVQARDLSASIDLLGWESNPLPYYENAGVYVVTSDREMLPLTLVEAMLVGVPPVTPAIGAIPDVLTHDANGLLVTETEPDAFADAITGLLTNPGHLAEMSEEAQRIEHTISVSAVADSWRRVFESLPSSRS